MIRSAFSVRRAIALVVSFLLLLMWVPGLIFAPASEASVVDTFEIEGNLNVDTPGNLDWANVLTKPTSTDPVGNAEDSPFQTSSKEDDDPLDWTAGTSNIDPKDDIGGIYAYTKTTFNPTPKVVFFAGWDRADGSGTDFYELELNQKPAQQNTAKTLTVPNRTAGDLRFNLHDQGSGIIVLEEVDKWTAGGKWHCLEGPTSGNYGTDSLACDVKPISANPAGFFYAVNENNNVDVPDNWTQTSPNAAGVVGPNPGPKDNGFLAPEQFVETGFDLTALGLVPDCPAPGFGSAMLRDITGNSHQNLKDYVAPIPVDIPSTCAKLIIKKFAADGSTALGGASFTVTPNPSTGAGSLNVTDGGANDADGTADGVITFASAKPGDYTVTETAPPPGYTLPPNADKSVSLHADSLQTVTFEFKDYLGSLAWEKVDATSGDHICCATFTVHRTGPAGVTQSDVIVTDNGTGDTDNRDGYVKVEGLKTGDYTITETAAPTGYDLPADPDQTTTITDVYSDRDVTLGTAFSDPRKTSTLKVKKVDESDNSPLAGATFQLWKESGVTAGLQTSGVDADTQIGADCVTDGNGLCSKSGLDFGTYYWRETAAPTGYNLPANPVSSPIVVNAGNAGSTFPITTFTDSQILSALQVKKVDAQHPAVVLSGATFELWKESGTTAGLQTTGVDADSKVGADCITDGSGLCTKSGLGFGSYYWRETAAPTGYDLPATTVQGPIVINAANAGGNPVSTTTFSDPEKTSSLRVEKVDADHPATHLSGAVFELWQESGATAGLQTTGGDADILKEGSCVTDANGFCSVSGLQFGSYYWREIVAPTGYDLPATTVQGPIVINAANAGGNPVSTTTFADPEKRSSLRVEKVDKDQPSTHLAGATFELWQESGAQAGLQTSGGNADTKVGADCVTDGTGFCTKGALPFGSYYWRETAAPTGYDLPSTTVQGPIVIDASNAGGNPVSTTTFSDPQVRSSLTVKKVDAQTQALLAGADFDLHQQVGASQDPGTDPVVDSCTTDGTGTCTINGLTQGTYYWEETAAPTGYDLPADTTSDSITIDASNAGTVLVVRTFSDPEKVSSLTVEKLDAEDQSPLADAHFTLWRESNGTPDLQTGGGTPDTSVSSCITNGTGTCSIGSLLFGTYYWEETAAPTGYDLPADTVSDPIVIDANNAGTTIAMTVFSDPQKPTVLTVEKIDEQTQALLAGGQFSLYKESNGVAGLQLDGTADTFVDDCVTDGTGTCSVGNLLFGTYYWVETAAPTGYGLPADTVSDPIVIDADNAGTIMTATVFSDPETPTTLTVLKVEEGSQTPLQGADFQLWQETNLVAGLQTTGSADTQVGSCTTAADGTCSVDNLLFGTYYWLETKAPTGYVLPSNPVSDPFVIDANNAGSRELPVTSFSDAQVLSEVFVKKVDSDTGAVLAGATFELWQDNGQAADTLVDSCTTDASGTCSVADLKFGTYYWVETEAPDGYLLPANPVSDPFVIDANNAGTDFAVVTFEDTPTGSMTIHKEVDKTSAAYNDTLTYTISLHAVGPQLQNDVTVKDYIPGYDPNDTVSGKVTYVDGSADCSVGCSTSYDADAHQLTWTLDASIPPPNDVTLTFKATIDTPKADANGGLPAEQLDNVAVVTSDHTPTTPSNKVVTRVIAVLGEKAVKPPKALPFTGTPLPVRMAVVLGTLMIGAGLIVNVSWRRRRS